MIKSVSIMVSGVRNLDPNHILGGELISDTVELTPEQWDLVLETLRGQVANIEKQTAWLVRPQLADLHNKLIEVLCLMDI